jgi:hypothetical protein
VSEDFTALARAKLERILGAASGEAVFRRTMASLGKESLATADDLYEFGRALSPEGGFVAAVGGLLCVQAAMAGATPPPTSPLPPAPVRPRRDSPLTSPFPLAPAPRGRQRDLGGSRRRGASRTEANAGPTAAPSARPAPRGPRRPSRPVPGGLEHPSEGGLGTPGARLGAR